jgi:transglutaminase-like putative cysteine protease
MQLIQRNDDSAFLQYDQYVNFDNPIVADKARELAARCKSTDEIIQTCYYFVRDEIPHTYDYNLSTIAISASDVLEANTGISYSKANLLAALLRANNLYTGFCYLRIKHKGGKLAMHALNAVYHPDLKRWVRLDARGNKYGGFNSDYTHNETQLGYTINPDEGEYEFDDLLAVPLPSTMRVLENGTNFLKMYFNDMPDYDD